MADLLEAGDPGDYDLRRQAVTTSMNEAYDGILSRRTRDIGTRSPRLRLLAQLNAVTPLVEASAAARLPDHVAAPEIPGMVRELAQAVAEGRTGRRPPEPPPARTPAERALNTALRHAASVVNERAPVLDSVADLLGRPNTLRFRARRATFDVLLSTASWRYGLRLALCIGIAQALVSVAALPRSYWIAVTVTYVLKPDFGSVFSRAVTRAIGTVVGLVVAAAIVPNIAEGWVDVPVIAVLAGIIPAASVKGYGFQTASITPVVLMLTDLLSHQGVHLVLPRFVDSLIGCAIVLVMGYLLWPESWHARIGDRLADTVDDAAGYLASAFGTAVLSDEDEAERARTRRRVYRALSVVRSEFQRALAEPPPAGPQAAAWLPLVVAVERIVDATTAARIRVNYGAAPPEMTEVAELQERLRHLARRVRTPRAEEVTAIGKGGGGGTLAGLRDEVEAACAIASTGPSRPGG